MTKERSTKIGNFMTTGAGFLVMERGHISHIVKMYYFFLLYSRVLMNGGTTQIFKFHDPRGRVFYVLGGKRGGGVKTLFKRIIYKMYTFV